jgi:hypothetical protein
MVRTRTLPAPAESLGAFRDRNRSGPARIGRRPIARPAWLVPVLLLTGCASSPGQLPAVDASYDGFPHCHGHGCASVSRVRLSDPERQQIRALMQPKAATPADERRRIQLAIAQLEKLAGSRTDTEVDRGGTFAAVGRSGQLDCIDESSNTRVYLHLLYDDDLLAWHQPAGLAHRGLLLVGGWPHTTAVIRERSSGAVFAVDSWFLDNGEPPFIVSLASWHQGWRP